MAILSRNQRIFASELVRRTGLDPRLVGSWIVAEEPAGASVPVGHNDQNWLNIGRTDSGAVGATAWRNPVSAADRTAAWLQGRDAVSGFGRAAPGIQAFARTAGQPVGMQVRALQRSGWASSGYPNLPGLVAQNAGKYGINGQGAGSYDKLVGAQGSPQELQTRNVLDRGGFQQAQRAFQLGQILQNQRSPFQDFGPRASIEAPDPLLSVLPRVAPAPGDYTRAVTSLRSLAGGLNVQHPGQLPKGLASFEGTKVAAWIAPILQYARSKGWTGSVTSGYRSFAQQKAIYDSGVRPAAVPGTSNHEGDAFPRGAVDASQATQLARIIARSPYRGRLVWAGPKDPVHFSHPVGGRY